MDMGTKGWVTPGWDWAGLVRFQHNSQNGTECKTYELFISGIFHLIFSDSNWLQVTETEKSKTTDEGGGL